MSAPTASETVAAAPAPAAAAPAPAAEPALTVDAAQTRITALLTAKPADWCGQVCQMFWDLMDSPALLENAALHAATKKLVSAAYADCNFAHCYLSVAEDMSYML